MVEQQPSKLNMRVRFPLPAPTSEAAPSVMGIVEMCYAPGMTIPVTRAAEGLPRRAFTVADVERMVEVGLIPPDERLEIIGGEIVPMSPKGNRHEQIKVALNMLWGRACPQGFAFAAETAVRPDPYNYLEPDFIIFDRRVELASLKGPDLLLAVELADSSLGYDLGRKAQLYAAFGARELWVVNAARRVTHVHLYPGPAGYESIVVRGADERLQPNFAPQEFAFALDDLKRL
jgi:Uma2 family endonuclease